MQKIPVVYSDVFLTDYDTVDCESPDRVAEGQLFAQAKEAALLNWILLPPEKTHPNLSPDQMPYLEQGTTE